MTAVNVPRSKPSVTPSSARTDAVAGSEVASEGVELESSHGLTNSPVAAAPRRWGAAESCGSGSPPPTSGKPPAPEGTCPLMFAGMARTVLVVDDSAAFRRSARMLLQARGYEVVGMAGRRRVGPRGGAGAAPGLRAAGRQPARRRRRDAAGQFNGAGGRARLDARRGRDRRRRGRRRARASSPRPSSPRRGSSNCSARHDPSRHRRGPGAAAPGDRAAARRRRLRGRRRGRRRARPAAQGRRPQARRRDRRRPDAARQHRRRAARGDGDPRARSRTSACSCSASTPRSATRST